jgi:hypothetical protein
LFGLRLLPLPGAVRRLSAQEPQIPRAAQRAGYGGYPKTAPRGRSFVATMPEACCDDSVTGPNVYRFRFVVVGYFKTRLSRLSTPCNAGCMATKKKTPKTQPDRPKRPRDPNQLAHALINEMTDRLEAASTPPKVTNEISKYMSALGRKGGLTGGNIRAAKLTKEQRTEIALKAARARWDKP